MINSQFIINLLFHGVILIFSGLSLMTAASSARAHLSWLIPTVLGWGLWLFATLLNLAFMASFRTAGYYSSNPLRWLLDVERWIYVLGMVCLAWAAVALYRCLQSTAFAPPAARAERPPESEGVWPPPPTV